MVYFKSFGMKSLTRICIILKKVKNSRLCWNTTNFQSGSIEMPNYVEIEALIGSVTQTDKIQDDINKGFGELKVEFQENTNKIIESNNKTQEALKENNETNKNIFQKIGDIFNILNPFSENFFAYKLIELLLNALKSLFIPSDNFFNNWLADLNEYFRR